jgi:hypothetical protein
LTDITVIANKIKELFFITEYYAVQREDGQYHPHRKAGKLLPITEEKIINSILDYSIVIGTYSTSQENLCKWFVIDFDTECHYDSIFRLRQDVFDAYKECQNHGLTPYIESSGHKGYHLWVLYNKVSSETAFRAVHIIGDKYKGEKFPIQPKLCKGLKFGNLVRLPCSLNKKSQKPSQWLDTNFRPLKNQLEFFMNIERSNIKNIERVAEQYNLPLKKEIEKIDITNEKVNLKNPLFKIDQRGRHIVQYQLIMKALEGGLNKSEIKELGKKWLTINKGFYEKSFEDAVLDFDKGLSYLWSRYNG